VVQQGGRLDEYLLETAEDSGLAIRREDVMQAGNAVCKTSYRLFRERGISATIMPAGLRGVHHLAAMAGAEMVFSLQARVQRLAIEADLPRVERIEEEIPGAVLERLRTIPEFVRAHDEDGLAPEEFLTFGVTQRTLSQFLWTGWAPLETYGTSGQSERWF
jgi:transaldolase